MRDPRLFVEYNYVTEEEENVGIHHKISREWILPLHHSNSVLSHNNMLALRDGKPIDHFQGAVSIRKTVLPGMAIPMLKIRRPNGRLIFNMEIAICR